MTPITLYYSARQFLLYIYFKRHWEKCNSEKTANTVNRHLIAGSEGSVHGEKKRDKKIVCESGVAWAAFSEFDLEQNVATRRKKEHAENFTARQCCSMEQMPIKIDSYGILNEHRQRERWARAPRQIRMRINRHVNEFRSGVLVCWLCCCAILTIRKQRLRRQ